MKMATETTPLTSGDESRTYLFLSQRHRNRRNKIRQFQCCVCAAMLGIFVTAMVITVSYSMNHDPEDDLTNNETDSDVQTLLSPPGNTAALKTLLSLKWPRPDVLPPDWPAPIPTDIQIAQAIEAGEMSLRNKDDIEARAAMKSDDPASPGILKLGTPSYLHQAAIKTSSLATKAARVGYIMGKATEQLMKGKSAKHAVGKGPQVNPYWIPTGMVCKAKGPTGGMNSSFAACPPSRYRTMDGTCNNLVHPDWGVAMRPLRRVIPPDYGDGISSPRVAKDGSILPSARDVSLTVHRPIYRNDPHFTVMLAVWGQFFDHDITATALSKSNDGTAISCCTSDGIAATENVSPECYPVLLSTEDPYYSDYGMTCMNFVRSAPAPTCNLGPREQLNQITSFIDGSVIYGSSDEQAKHLRSTTNKGELVMMVTPDGRELLPASTDPKDGCNKPEMNADGKYCFKSGDTRANENLHLTTMHLLMAREHNRIVRALSKMNPTWSDERLYQEGRHIVSAQMQHITYHEFLPVVLGQSMMSRLKLDPQKEGYFKEYEPEVNPAVANNFATAAFRFAHTLLPTLMKILGNDTASEEYVELHKILFDPYALYYPGKMDGALKGALNTDVQRVDTYITPEVTQHLFQQKWGEDYDKAMEKAGSPFKGKKKGYGLDLASLNVQRGRDHGLPSYPEWREYCGLSRPRSFSDLSAEMDEAALERLASLYKSVDDVDMYSGSLSEIPIGEGLLGPTFSCLIGDQFLRLKTGDRYWYETSELPQAFTPEQLAEIRRASLASVICENSGVDRVQQWVMQAVEDSNPRVMCEYIPRLRLEAWQDNSMVGRVKLSPFSMHVKVEPKKLEELTPPSETAGSLFIKGTVASATISALGSDGTVILAMTPSTTFPMTLPIHLFDQKVPVTADTSDFVDGIIPPFYHGGGGVTWTGSLISSDPTKAHIEGSFSVPVFKHGTTAFDFSMTTYTGSFDIYLNLAPSASPLGVPTLQGTYNSGIYFKTEPSTMTHSEPSMKDIENLIADSDTGGPKLPMAPVSLYGAYSLDRTEFYWDGNVSVIIPSPMMPIIRASGDGMVKPKIPTTTVDVSAVWGVINAKAGPPPNPMSANSKTVVTTWWDGTLPVAIPQPAFDRTIVASIPLPASSKTASPGDGVTWSGSLTTVDGSDDVQLNGTFSFPVFYHGASPSGFTLQIWRGTFSIILRSSPTPGVIPLATSLRLLGTGKKYKSPLYFRDSPMELTPLDDESVPSNITVPVILHGHNSIDKSIFYWNGNASVIVPQVFPSILMARGRGISGRDGGESKFKQDGFSQNRYQLKATEGSPTEPLILTITSASVTMTSTQNTNTTGKNITWNGEFPVTLPQSPFYRKSVQTLTKSGIDPDYPYSPLAVPPSSTKISYKSELTWSNLSAKMIDSTTNDIQINGSLSFPVYYFTSMTVGPWPGPTIENWNGNFSVMVNANSTTGSPVSVDSILSLLSMGNFASSVFYTEESNSLESGKLAASMSADDSDTTTPLKVIMLLHGIKSMDKTEFYWNGVMTLIIRGLPELFPSSFVQSIYNAGNPSIAIRGSYISGRVTGGSVMGQSLKGKTYWWSGFFPVPIEMPAFDSISPNAGVYNWPFVPTTFNGTGGVTWSGTLSRQTSGNNGISVKGSFSLPVFIHGNPSAFSVDEWNGDFEIEMNLFNDSPLIDLFKSGVYNSPMIFREQGPDGQGGMPSSYLDTINKVQNIMMTNFVSPSGSVRASQPRVPIILWGHYSPDKSIFYWNGNASFIFPPMPSRLFASMNNNSADSDSEVTPPSKNVKLPFKIMTGSLSVTSPVFGKKILWDGKIPFRTLRSYFNGNSGNTSYIGGPMKWTGRITRSTNVVNGAHIKGSYSLPVFVRTKEGVTAEALTGDLSLSISFIGPRNLVDWIPNEGTYSSIITIAPGKPSDKALEDDSGPIVKMAINKLMKSIADEISHEDSNVMVLPACFFGDYDPLHFTFTGDGITIVPANVSALVSKKHKNTLWDISPADRLQNGPIPSYATDTKLLNPLTRSLRQIYHENDGSKNIKLPFKILSGSLTSKSPTLGEKVLWDGQIPFTINRSYFNGYSNITSFIGGPIKWTGHISRTSSVGNGAQIEGSFSVPIFVHSNDTVSVEFMAGDLSLQILFSGTQNIVELVPSKGNFSSYINIRPAYIDVELSLTESQLEAKSNMLLNMALNEIMNSIEIENTDSDSDALIAMPVCLFGYYHAENFTFNGDALAIIPANISNPASLEYEVIVQDMTPATKLKIGAASPYVSGTVTSGNVMGLSKGGRTFWWNGDLPLPISMPPFDSVSPYAGVFNWPFNPTFYNGTGGVTWSGTMATTTSVKNGLNVKGSFTVPTFTHGNPNVFSVDEWNGDFELEMSIFYNNTALGSSFPTGTYNSPMFFRESKTLGSRDPSGYDLKTIKEVENMMILSTNLGLSGGVNSAMPRVPVILWGNYSIDKTVFYWEGNITAIFPPIPNNLFTALSELYSEKDSEDMSGDKRLRLSMKILTGKITSTSPVFGERILWDGTVPFTTMQSYFSKYSTNSSFIGGPVQWAGQISRDPSIGNGAQIKGSFAVPMFVPSNGTESFVYLTGDFSFVVSFNGTQNIVDLIPNTGKFSSYIILGVSHDEFESYMVESDDDEPSTQNEHLKMKMKQLAASKNPESGTSLATVLPIIFLGNYGSKNFTFNGEAIAIIPEAKPLPATPKLLGSSPRRSLPFDQFHDKPYSKRDMPSSQINDLPYPIPFPSYFNPKSKAGRKVKIFGIIKSGQLYGGNLGHRTRPMWEGSFPALIPMPAFDRRSHHNESRAGHPHHPHRMDGGITWEATEIGESRDGGYVEGNFFFPIYKHGRYHTYSIKMWTGQFSFHFTLPGDQSIEKMVKYWKRYTSKMYFHHFHSDWDLFNPGSHADELRDKANKLDSRINRSPNNGPIIILKGKREKSVFSWSGKFILVFTV